MKAKIADWYKHGWALDIKKQSWVDDTENQVNFIIKTLHLAGKNVFLIWYADMDSICFRLCVKVIRSWE